MAQKLGSKPNPIWQKTENMLKILNLGSKLDQLVTTYAWGVRSDHALCYQHLKWYVDRSQCIVGPSRESRTKPTHDGDGARQVTYRSFVQRQGIELMSRVGSKGDGGGVSSIVNGDDKATTNSGT